VRKQILAHVPRLVTWRSSGEHHEMSIAGDMTCHTSSLDSTKSHYYHECSFTLRCAARQERTSHARTALSKCGCVDILFAYYKNENGWRAIVWFNKEYACVHRAVSVNDQWYMDDNGHRRSVRDDIRVVVESNAPFFVKNRNLCFILGRAAFFEAHLPRYDWSTFKRQ